MTSAGRNVVPPDPCPLCGTDQDGYGSHDPCPFVEPEGSDGAVPLPYPQRVRIPFGQAFATTSRGKVDAGPQL